MLKKTLILAAFAITPLLLSESASAQCYSSGYGHRGVYRAPVSVYRVPRHPHAHYRAGYRGHYPRSFYGSPYRYRAGYRYGGIGYPSYYGRGSSISVGRGGFGISVGF